MPAQFDFNVHECWRIIRRRKWWGICVFLLVVGSVMFLTLRQLPVWEASVTMKVSSQAPFATIQGTSISYYGARSGLDTETKLIEESTALHQQVVDLLRQQDASDPSKPVPVWLNAKTLRSMITAEQVERSDLVRIRIQGSDPVLTARVANAVAQCYNKLYISARTREAEEKMNLIKSNLDKVQADLDATDEKIKAFQQDDQTAGTSAIYRNRLAKVEVQLTQLRQKYTDDHPQVIKLLEEKHSLEARLKPIPQKELDLARLESKRDKLSGLQGELSKQYFASEVDHQAKKEEITQKISLLGDARDNVRKIRPHEGLNAVVGALLGTVIGVILCFVVEALDTSIGTIEDVEHLTGLSVLGLIPYISKGANHDKAAARNENERDDVVALRQRIILNVPSNSMMSEAYRVLRTDLQFVMPNKPKNHVVLISSAGPGEGKTLNALNLSIVLAQAGARALYVDADLRHPIAHRALGLARDPGLSDMLTGKVSMQDCVRSTEDLLMGAMEWDTIVAAQGMDNLGIITCGAFCQNPTELLASANAHDVVNILRSEWEYVIIDTAPIIPVADPTILAQLSDGVLMVYQVGKSSRQILLRALKQMRATGGNMLGIILNQMEEDVQFYSYKYYRPYAVG